jgi:hypothetical protein
VDGVGIVLSPTTIDDNLEYRLLASAQSLFDVDAFKAQRHSKSNLHGIRRRHITAAVWNAHYEPICTSIRFEKVEKIDDVAN